MLSLTLTVLLAHSTAYEYSIGPQSDCRQGSTYLAFDSTQPHSNSTDRLSSHSFEIDETIICSCHPNAFIPRPHQRNLKIELLCVEAKWSSQIFSGEARAIASRTAIRTNTALTLAFIGSPAPTQAYQLDDSIFWKDWSYRHPRALSGSWPRCDLQPGRTTLFALTSIGDCVKIVGATEC